MVADSKSNTKRKKSLSYVDRLKLAKKNKKSRKKKSRSEAAEKTPDSDESVSAEDKIESAVRSTGDGADGQEKPDLCPLPRKCQSEPRDVSTSSYHSLRLDDTYSCSKLSDSASDFDESVWNSIKQSLFHNSRSSRESVSSQQLMNESLRWELAIDAPDEEKERLRVYKLNRRKRYLAHRQTLERVAECHGKKADTVALTSKMAQMSLTPTRKRHVVCK